MEELRKILNSIMDISEKDINKEEKSKILVHLWTNYYKLSQDLNLDLSDTYFLSLALEN